MKEFLYSLALCLLLSAGWLYSHVPDDEDLAAAQEEPALVATLERQQRQMSLIAAGALAGSAVLGVCGFFARSRRQAHQVPE